MAVSIESRGDVLLPGTPKELFSADIVFSNSPYDISPDGRKIVGISSEGRSRLNDPMMVIMNWKRNE